MGHLEDRIQSYVYDRGTIDRTLSKFMRKFALDNNIANETPIFQNMDEYQVI